MRFFASWWERVPVRQVSSVIAVVVVIGVLSFHVGAGFKHGGTVYVQLQKPAGEIWD